jgi:hypothetical protein
MSTSRTAETASTGTTSRRARSSNHRLISHPPTTALTAVISSGIADDSPAATSESPLASYR